MKAKIISRHMSRMENGVRKGYGDEVEVTKEELKSGNYAPLKVNVKPKKVEKVETISEEDVQQADNPSDGG